MSTSSNLDPLHDGLRLVSYCPVCETRYNPIEAKLLGQDGDTRLMHVQCRKCQHTVLALVLVNQVGASSIGILTDLSYTDVLKFTEHQRLSINDVLEVHRFFEQKTWQQTFLPKRRSKVKRIRS